MARLRRVFVILIFLFFANYTWACEDSLTELALRNIRQLTFSNMGFFKAGEAYFSPDDKSIIFQAVPHGESSYQIFIMKLDNIQARMVSTGQGACTCPYFRPDGQKIIFASSHEDPRDACDRCQQVSGYQRDGGDCKWQFLPYTNIYEANIDGSELRALTKGKAYHAECAYSHDGSHIVFASNLDGCMNIYTMSSDGDNIQQVTRKKHGYSGGSFFSPDSKQIIYRADYKQRDFLQIYIINIDGTNRKKITNNNHVNWAPFWHPNNKIIAYTTSCHGHDRYEIYLLNIHTGQEYRLTNSPGFDGIPAFSNDGTKILWTSKCSEDKSCQVFIADLILPQELL